MKNKCIFIISMLLLFSSCAKSIDFTISPELHSKLEQFLLSQPDINAANFGGKVYCAYKVLETRQRGNDKYIDLWVVAKEMYYDTNTKAYVTGAASSIPVSIRVTKDNNYTPVSYKYPGDGSFYARDIKKIFSKRMQKKILYQQFDLTELHNSILLKLERDTDNYNLQL